MFNGRRWEAYLRFISEYRNETLICENTETNGSICCRIKDTVPKRKLACERTNRDLRGKCNSTKTGTKISSCQVLSSLGKSNLCV